MTAAICFDVKYIQALPINHSQELFTFATNFNLTYQDNAPVATLLDNFFENKYMLSTIQTIQNPANLKVLFWLPAEPIAPLTYLMNPKKIPLIEKIGNKTSSYIPPVFYDTYSCILPTKQPVHLVKLNINPLLTRFKNPLNKLI